MAVSVNTQWDVRPATGSDSNGGGFVAGASGSDFSQQTSAQYALTGIASGGAGNTVLSASAAADMVGNIANVISGTNFNTGFFEITSVSVGVSITFGTRKDGSSICTGVGASGVINIGGSLASIGVLGLSGNANAYDHNIIWVKGTLVLTSSISGDSSISYAGYGTTHGDGTRATITTATNSTKLFTWGNVYEGRFENFNFTNTASVRDKGFTLTSNWATHFKNCLWDGFTVAVFGGFPAVAADTENSLHFIDCEIKNCTGTDGTIQLYDPRGCLFFGCYFHDNAGDAVQLNGGNGNPGMLAFVHCVFDTNGGRGISVTSGSAGGRPARSYSINHCVFYNNTSDGVKFASSSYQDFIHCANCIFYLNGGYGFFRDTTTDLNLMMFGQANAYGSNTSGPRGGMWPTFTGDVALSADPFTNGAAGDFTLNATAGGGAALKTVGYESNIV